MDSRVYDITKILYDENKTVSSLSLSRRLDVSIKTVQSIIKDNMSYFDTYGFSIHSSLLGYTLDVLDDSLFNEFIYKSPQNKGDVLQEMIIKLLDSQDYLKINDIADELYISRATADRTVKKMKYILRDYDLDIESKSKYGIKIIGNEVNKRICYAFYTSFDNENMGLRVQKILINIFKEYSFEMSDTAFQALNLHICIMIRRILCGNEIKEVLDIQDYTKEASIADRIVLELEKEFQITICSSEQQYILIHLLGKQIMTNTQFINIQVFEYIDMIFDEIKLRKNIDFHNDLELRTVLAMHIQPMLQRMKFHLRQKNPLVEHVKREMIEGYELAVLAGNVMKDKGLWIVLDEDELSFLALHFSLALEKHKDNDKKTKVLIVCASGRGTSQLIQYRLMNRYHLNEDNLVVTSLLKLKDINMNEYACIMSTIPLKDVYPIPVIMIDPTMNNQSMKRIDTFMNSHLIIKKILEKEYISQDLLFYNQELSSREEVIRFMCNNIKNKIGVDYYESIMEREFVNATEVGNQCSLPHPMSNSGNHTILSLLTLKKPILWENTLVKYVFLIILPENQNELSRMIMEGVSHFICEIDRLYELDKEPLVKDVLKMMYEEDI